MRSHDPAKVGQARYRSATGATKELAAASLSAVQYIAGSQNAGTVPSLAGPIHGWAAFEAMGPPKFPLLSLGPLPPSQSLPAAPSRGRHGPPLDPHLKVLPLPPLPLIGSAVLVQPELPELERC